VLEERPVHELARDVAAADRGHRLGWKDMLKLVEGRMAAQFVDVSTRGG